MEIPRRTTVLQTGGGIDKFDLTASSLGGAAREYKMYFKDETTQEWLVDLHDAMTKDTLDFLKDIKNKRAMLRSLGGGQIIKKHKKRRRAISKL